MFNSEQVKQKRDIIESLQTELSQQITDLRKKCSHQNLTYKYGGSSGNWDKSDDCYWIDWNCEDCGHSWNTSQENAYDLTTRVYPHAKRIR